MICPGQCLCLFVKYCFKLLLKTCCFDGHLASQACCFKPYLSLEIQIFFFLISCLNVHWCHFSPLLFIPSAMEMKNCLLPSSLQCLCVYLKTSRLHLNHLVILNKVNLFCIFRVDHIYGLLILLTALLWTSGFSAVCPNFSVIVLSKIGHNISPKNLVLNTVEKLLHALQNHRMVWV